MSHVIALVDDDRNILTSVSIALQAEGFVTRVYTDGATALNGIGFWLAEAICERVPNGDGADTVAVGDGEGRADEDIPEHAVAVLELAKQALAERATAA